MEYIGVFALMIAMMNIDAGSKIKKLATRLKKLEKNTKPKGENTMSRLIQSLINAKCTVLFDEEIQMGPYAYDILDADEDWVKIRREDKKGNEEVRIVRIEDIKELKPVE
ncbi:hypothetical protein [Streptococcus ovis]|uniref:hypothetical protein n=1 Tax=Streptococcus ovis TaxID=82806 RepID=UPI000369BC5B|nr:hypothetical protein [Streptococcus ovis]